MEQAISLPALDSDYDLTEEQIERYRRDGHILLRGVCTPSEIAAYGRVIREAAMRHAQALKPIEERDTYGKAFIQVMNLWELDPYKGDKEVNADGCPSGQVSRGLSGKPGKLETGHPLFSGVANFTLSRRFASIAGRLMGVDAVRLYHDQALFKEAGGGHTPWHQDQFYWPLDSDRAITMWMPLVLATPEMGTMRFASGSQREGYLGPIGISDESEEKFAQFVAERGYSVSDSPSMEAGDATFHSGWTLHSAPANATGTMREAMTVIYYPDGTRILEPDHQNRQNDLERWFPGQKPGELAGTRLNPVVWERC